MGLARQVHVSTVRVSASNSLETRKIVLVVSKVRFSLFRFLVMFDRFGPHFRSWSIWQGARELTEGQPQTRHRLPILLYQGSEPAGICLSSSPITDGHKSTHNEHPLGDLLLHKLGSIPLYPSYQTPSQKKYAFLPLFLLVKGRNQRHFGGPSY